MTDYNKDNDVQDNFCICAKPPVVGKCSGADVIAGWNRQ